MTDIPATAGPADLHRPFATTAIQTDLDGPVLRIRLGATPEDNTFTVALLDDLLAVLHALHDRPEIRVLLLTGAGADFNLGAERTEFQTALAHDPTGTALRRMNDKALRVCEALENTHAITIARLHGRVIGAGLALASYCDLRAGADDCRFRMPEVALGLPPAWGGAMGRLIAEAGVSHIRELMLTGENFDAATAQRLGLLHKVAPRDGLDAAVDSWIRPLLRRAPEALVLTKRMLNGYARAARTAEVGLLDAHLLSAHLGLAQNGQSAPPPAPVRS
ncbi:enoyl-CoA hydratase/isomerase family protein [Streptomyces sp. SID685]|uniref:enoyl-CoA hydratase/isomerase family protein n=1 Tax=Streptomyces TaxID=1883 RepID=UPI001367F239|nr:enoyl-CoA hydratase/isomerase family protein [Streptomyces sp. SID685]MYR86696.1 enoyl-CoA hydratase/isomerase family protein [Streptomyces sp. SID685]